MFLLSSPIFYDLDVHFYIFMFFCCSLWLSLSQKKKFFLICVQAYFSNLLSNCDFFPPFLFPYRVLLLFYLEKTFQDFSVFPLGQV